MPAKAQQSDESAKDRHSPISALESAEVGQPKAQVLSWPASKLQCVQLEHRSSSEMERGAETPAEHVCATE